MVLKRRSFFAAVAGALLAPFSAKQAEKAIPQLPVRDDSDIVVVKLSGGTYRIQVSSGWTRCDA